LIDTALKVIDRLVELGKLPERNRKKYLDETVQPLYDDAEVVVSDYIGLFRDLIRRLKEGQNIQEIIDWLELRRLEIMPVRIKLRSYLENMDDPKFHTNEPMDRFKAGIWRLMRGGISLVELGHIDFPEYGLSMRHTVLDLLHLYGNRDLPGGREFYIKAAQDQLSCIERAWAEVTTGYVQLRNELK